MRRRTDDTEQLPAELVMFDGYQYRTETAWRAAFDEFAERRQKWAKDHGLQEHDLPRWEIDGNCPFDPTLI